MIPAVYLAAVLDTSLGPALDVGPVAPDMLAVVALVWSLTIGGSRGHLVTGAIGFMSDLMSPGRPGAGLAGFAIVGFILTRSGTRFGARHPLALALWAWPAATIMVLSPAVARRALGEVDLNWITLLVRGLGAGAYTAGMTLAVLGVIVWTGGMRRRRQWDL
ncbi:MAG TPA: rod shape-determining protein MreD [Pirellulales bacterium]|nr:rod shape-determining protein MreD [Pirellulales bacterium]